MDKYLENIYLVGLMGAGKTTIGRSLAKRLGRKFVDTDKEIEAKTRVSIPAIFEIEGESGFRNRESQVISELTAQNGIVVATGGGAVLRMENRAMISTNGFVVYLCVQPQTLLERTRHDRNRPLLQVADPLRRLEELFVIRDPLYRNVADLVIEGSRMSAQGVLQLLLKEVSIRQL